MGRGIGNSHGVAGVGVAPRDTRFPFYFLAAVPVAFAAGRELWLTTRSANSPIRRVSAAPKQHRGRLLALARSLEAMWATVDRLPSSSNKSEWVGRAQDLQGELWRLLGSASTATQREALRSSVERELGVHPAVASLAAQDAILEDAIATLSGRFDLFAADLLRATD